MCRKEGLCGHIRHLCRGRFVEEAQVHEADSNQAQKSCSVAMSVVHKSMGKSRKPLALTDWLRIPQPAHASIKTGWCLVDTGKLASKAFETAPEVVAVASSSTASCTKGHCFMSGSDFCFRSHPAPLSTAACFASQSYSIGSASSNGHSCFLLGHSTAGWGL